MVLLPATAKAEGNTPPALTEAQIVAFGKMSEDDRVRTLIMLCKSGQHERAADLLARYPLSSRHAANRTLFLEGLILKGRGDYTGATKKFRMALAADPKLTLVRAELAETLVILQQDDSATHHLRLLAADAPTEEAAAGVRAFIEKVDERTPFRFTTYVSLAPSTNVNNGSRHETVYTASGFGLTINNQKESGIGGAIGASAGYSQRLGNDFMFVAAANGEARIYNDPDYNAYSLSQSIEMRYLLDKGYLGLGGVASQSLKNDEFGLAYISYGPRASLRYNLTKKDSVSASVIYEWRDDHKVDSNDGTALMLDASWTHAFNSSFNTTIFGGYDDVRANGALVSYDAYSGGLSIYKELPWGITTNVTGELRHAAFDGFNLLVGKYREDWRLNGEIEITKRDWDLFGLAPSLSYSYTDNISNIELYDFDAHAVDFRLTKEF